MDRLSIASPKQSINRPKVMLRNAQELFWFVLFNTVSLILVLCYVLLASSGGATDWVFAGVISAFVGLSIRHVYIHYERPIDMVLEHAKHIQKGSYSQDDIIQGVGRFTELSTLMRSFGADFEQVSYSYKTQVSDLHYQIEKSEAFYKGVLQSVEDAVVVCDEEGSIVAVNDSAGELFAYEDSLLTLCLDDLLYEKGSESNVSDQALYPESDWLGVRKKLTAKRSSGQVFPVYTWINRTQVGDECFYTTVISDISERAELKRQLSSMGAKLNAAIYSSVIGFGTIDSKGLILDANQKFLSWIGLEELETLDQATVFTWVNKDYRDEIRRAIHQVLQEGIANYDVEVQLRCASGQSIWVFMSFSRGDESSHGGDEVVFQALDINRERQLIEQIEAKNEQLEQRNEDLDQFAYVASHDLKSPLNAIVKLISWVKEDTENQLDETVNGHLDLIESRAARMGNLLDALLLYSRVGRKDYGYENVSLKQVVEEIFDLLDNSHNFSLSCDDIELYVPLVPLQIVVRNLLSNAIKHHHTGTGKLIFNAREEAGHYYIAATDDGPGIPQDLQSKALEVFQTLKPRDEVEGSGVGLPLIQRIIHRYGGTMQLQSDGQSGTTIALTWPIVENINQPSGFSQSEGIDS